MNSLAFEQLITVALEKSLFAGLFIFTFFFVINENKKREEAQRDLYSKLAESLDKAKDAIVTIENKVERIDNKSSDISQDVTEIKYMISSMESIVRNTISRK